MSTSSTFISTRLIEIAKEHDVTVLYAAEAGSRAWGFPSTDSDYDVRFIYMRSRDHYLSLNIEHERDTIEWMSDDHVYDFSGWDLRKCLKLMQRSNPALIEWFWSPIVYVRVQPHADVLYEAAAKSYNRVAAHYHYMSMAKNNFNRWLTSDRVRFKKYLYVIRPLMAVNYIATHDTPPPVNYFALVTECSVPDAVKERVRDLIRRKANADELSDLPRDDVLHTYITETLQWKKPVYDIPDKMNLNDTFLSLLPPHNVS